MLLLTDSYVLLVVYELLRVLESACSDVYDALPVVSKVLLSVYVLLLVSTPLLVSDEYVLVTVL